MNPNSALYYIPKLQNSALRDMIPRSLCVPYSQYEMICQIGDHPFVAEGWSGVLTNDLSTMLDKAKGAAERIGYPVFIRGDLASAKHDGPQAYLANSPADIEGVLCNIAADSDMKFWIEPEGGPAAFIIRPFLNLDAPFTAFHGLPIAREWRFFASANEVICAHPYWPKDSIKFYRETTEPDNWPDLLEKLHEQPSEPEWDMLHQAAMTAAKLANRHPAWSVDFAQDTAGKWWLIDMATKEKSFHYPGCLNADLKPMMEDAAPDDHDDGETLLCEDELHSLLEFPSISFPPSSVTPPTRR